MPTGRGSPAARSGRRTLSVAAVLFFMALASMAPTSGAVHGAAVAPTGGPPPVATSSVVPSIAAAPSTGAVASSPLASSGTAEFFANTTVPTNLPFMAAACESSSYTGYQYNDCYNDTINPTMVSLNASEIGLAYQVNTNATRSSCAASSSMYDTEIGWSVSSTNGTSWGPMTIIANHTCSYVNSIEPSFTAQGSTVYGAFVQVNDYYYSPGYYQNRPDSALGFVKSTDNGATFTEPITLPSGYWVAYPRIAAVGSTIYIVYENLTNLTWTTTPMGGPGGSTTWDYPIGIYFMSSTDGGATWSAPQVLPEENASAYYTSTGPSIAVSPDGTVGVAYFTNESCVMMESWGWCEDYGYSLVVVTSTNNGSSWNGPFTVKNGVGASIHPVDTGWSYSWEPAAWAPHSEIAFNGTGGTIFLAWEGVYDEPLPYESTYFYQTGIFFASGPTSGGPWTVRPLDALNNSNNEDNLGLPSMVAQGDSVYVGFEWDNETSWCSVQPCSELYGSKSVRLESSTDGGATWSGPIIVGAQRYGTYCSPGCAESWNPYVGETTSVVLAANDSPLIAYPISWLYTYTYAYANGISYSNYSYLTDLHVGYIASQSVVPVTFVENGLPTTSWAFSVNGATIAVEGSNSYTLTNVPVNVTVLLGAGQVPLGWGERAVGTVSAGAVAVFVAPTTVYVNYTLQWALNLTIMPEVVMDAYLDFNVGGTGYDLERNAYCYNYSWMTKAVCYVNSNSYPSFPPWFFDAGARIDLGGQGSTGIGFWNGTGNGSFTGVGIQANVTMNGPINETAWAGGIGFYNESFIAKGLPSTSVYHYDFAGRSFAAPGNALSIAPGVYTGMYAVTNIWANSSQAGWEYFGTPDVGSPVIVPAEPVVNLSFAYVDVGAPVGTISFHAAGLSVGTVWDLGFNGTEYSSSTPWINVTEHSGTFPVVGYPVVAANGSVGYTPSGIPSSWSVSTGSTYLVTYVNAYRVVATAGTGGTVLGTGHGTMWLAAGGSASFHAVASGAYTFGGWTGSGSGSYTGPSTYANVTVNGPIVELAAFYPLPVNRFNITFTEQGLAPGTPWTVFLSGVGYSSVGETLQITNLYPCGPLGTYNVSVPYAFVNGTTLVRFAPVSHPKTVCSTGIATFPIVYDPQYYLTLQSSAGGFGEATVGSLTTTTSTWVANGSSVDLSVFALPSYIFLGWNGSGIGAYTGPSPSPGFIMLGPVTEVAVFGPPPVILPSRYWLSVSESLPLVSGTTWSITLNGVGYTAAGPSINISGLLSGPYAFSVATAYSPDGLARYSPVSAPSTVQVSRNATLPVSFSTSYWVSVSATPGGVVNNGVSIAGWYRAGQTLMIAATPNDGFEFLGWSGTGTGSYTGTDNTSTFPISAPVTELASFEPIPAPTTPASSGSVWTSPPTWIGLAVVGLVVGVTVGVLVGRRGRPAEPAATSEAETEGAAAGEKGGSP